MSGCARPSPFPRPWGGDVMGCVGASCRTAAQTFNKPSFSCSPVAGEAYVIHEADVCPLQQLKCSSDVSGILEGKFLQQQLD